MHQRGQSPENFGSVELADSYWNGEQEELLINCAASLALPYLWQSAGFMAQKRLVSGEVVDLD